MQRANSYQYDYTAESVRKKAPRRKRKKRSKIEPLFIKHKPDFLLFICILTLILLGMIMVYSASWPESLKTENSPESFIIKQLEALGFGFICLIAAYVIPVSFYNKIWSLVFLAGLALNALTFTGIGIEKYGAKRWISLGKIQFMPSDFIKITSIIAISAFIANNKKNIKSTRSTVYMFLIIGLTGGIIYKQNDLGTTAVTCAVLLTLAFLGGLNLGGMALAIGGIAIAVRRLIGGEGFRSERISVFKDPFQDKLGKGLQAVQSLYALGSGGLSGQGLGRSVQKYSYLPFSYNDFIFAVMGEELGFVRTLLYIIVLFIFVMRGMYISARVRDTYSKYLSMGIILLIGIQSLVHILVALAALPTKGICLPFISQGGTSLVSFMMMTGMLLQISRTADLRKKEDK